MHRAIEQKLERQTNLFTEFRLTIFTSGSYTVGPEFGVVQKLPEARKLSADSYSTITDQIAQDKLPATGHRRLTCRTLDSLIFYDRSPIISQQHTIRRHEQHRNAASVSGNVH